MSDDNARVGINIAVTAAELKTLIKTLREADANAKQSKSGFQVFTDSVKQAGQSFLAGAAHATRLHHALRIAHHLTRIATEAFSHFRDSLNKSLEMRFNDDPIKRATESIGRIGAKFNNLSIDRFGPLIVGVAHALEGLAKEFEGSARAGMKLQQAKILEWFAKLGPIIVDGVVVAIELLSRAVLGVRIAWNGLKVLVDFFFEKNFAYLAAWIDGLAHVATAIKSDSEIAKGLRSAADSVYGLAKTFEASGDVAKAAILEDARTLDGLDQNVEAVGARVKKAIGEAAADGMRHLGQQTHWATENVKALQEQMEKAATKSITEKMEADLTRAISSGNWSALDGLLQAAHDHFDQIITGTPIERTVKLNELMEHLGETVKHLKLDSVKHDLEEMGASFGKLSAHYDHLAKISEEAGKAQAAEQDEILAQAREGIPQLIAAMGTFKQMQAQMDPLLGGGMTKDMQKHFRDLQKAIHDVANTIAGELVNSITQLAEKTVTVEQFFKNLGKTFVQTAAQWVIAKGIEIAASRLAGAAEVDANTGKAASSAAAAAASNSAAASEIPAKAAVAAAGAAESQSSIPIIGPALAVAAAIAIFALVMGLAHKFAGGGMVTGGTPGKDSVLIAAMPGEYVIPEPVVRDIKSGRRPSRPGHYASGGMVSHDGGLTTIVRHERTWNVQLMMPLSSAEFDRWQRDSVVRSNNRMAQLGYSSVMGR